jgi:catechol 2,3-dioxygenase-like lactoylglutathione lyase family enzyme
VAVERLNVAMPLLTGILETVIYVDDLRRAIGFYEAIFRFEMLQSDARFCAFNVANRQVLLLFQRGSSLDPTALSGGTIPPHDGSGPAHFAFSIPAGSQVEWDDWLAKNGVAVESRVTWPRGSTSLYFRDPDQHLVELATPGIWAIY